MLLNKKKLQRPIVGFTYLEVLIALTIVTISLSGHLSLQSNTLATTKYALDINQAIFILDDLANRIMLTNSRFRDRYVNNEYWKNTGISSVKTCFNIDNPCNYLEFLQFNISQIKSRMANVFSSYQIEVHKLDKLYIIYMVWSDTSMQDCIAIEGGNFCLVMKIFA